MLLFGDVPIWEDRQPRRLLLNYRDTAQRVFSSEIKIRRDDEALLFYSVRIFDGFDLFPVAPRLMQPEGD